jgi:hypothetical protein
MLSKELPFSPAVSDPRRIAAAVLREAGRALSRLARRLGRRRERVRGEPVYEFYAEAGAPEGALYVDGQLVGHLTGVSRL